MPRQGCRARVRRVDCVEVCPRESAFFARESLQHAQMHSATHTHTACVRACARARIVLQAVVSYHDALGERTATSTRTTTTHCSHSTPTTSCRRRTVHRRGRFAASQSVLTCCNIAQHAATRHSEGQIDSPPRACACAHARPPSCHSGRRVIQIALHCRTSHRADRIGFGFSKSSVRPTAPKVARTRIVVHRTWVCACACASVPVVVCVFCVSVGACVRVRERKRGCATVCADWSGSHRIESCCANATREEHVVEHEGMWDSETGKTRACPICLEQYKKGDRLRTLLCLHQFHCDCVDPWLRSVLKLRQLSV